MQVASIQLGKSKTYKDSNNKQFQSSFIKTPIKGGVLLKKNGFIGDTQSDKKNHGGEEKALMVFSLASQALYKKEYKKEFQNGIFGENLTVSGLDEKNTFIGDIFQIGSAKVEVSQPRQPCKKVSFFLKEERGLQFMYRSGLTGWYFRVLQEGAIQEGDTIEKQRDGDKRFSVFTINSLRNRSLDDQELLKEALAYPKLSDEYKKDLQLRLKI